MPQNDINDEKSDELFQVYQVENNIFYHGNQPQRDNRFRCYEYAIFLFYKCNNILTRHFENNLLYGYAPSGNWRLGDYTVIQYDGPAPLNNVFENAEFIRREMDSLQNSGQVDSYKLRFKYPELP